MTKLTWWMKNAERGSSAATSGGERTSISSLSDINKMCRSGDRAGLNGLIQVRICQGWFGWVRLVRASQGGEDLWLGWVGLGWVGVGGWVG